MKKQLLTLCASIGLGALLAQVPAPNFSTNQHAIYPNPSAVQNPAVKFLDAVDANVIWTVGYNPFGVTGNFNWYSKSVNGGSNFSGGNIFSDTNTYHIANLEGIDANTAWVSSFMKATSSKGAIHRTTNGGANWFNMTAPGMYTNTAAFTNIVSFFTPSVGITQGDPVNGEYEIWRTTDGGNSWSMVPGANIPNPLAGEFAIVDLYYKHGSNNLWFGTNGGRMYRTTDAGITWSVATVAPTTTLLEIAFTSPMIGITTVFTASQTVELFNTLDGGQTWNFIGQPANFGYADIGGIPGTGLFVSVGIGGGNEIVSISYDNGLTWIDQGSTVIPYTTVDFVDASNGWLGSLDFTTTAVFNNVWKYSGAPFTGTVTPTASFTMSPVLCLSGNSASLIPANNSVGSPQNTYGWSASAGAVISNPAASTPTITFPAAGVYTITLAASNSLGTNISSQEVTVVACSAPAATFTVPANICTNYSFTAANMSTGAPSPTYSWSVLPTAQSTITPSPFAASPGIRLGNASSYTVTLVSTNASGSSSYSQVITPTVCAPVGTFTVPATFTYCATSPNAFFQTSRQTTNPPGATGPNSYTWTIAPNTGLGTPPLAPNPFAPNVIVTPQANFAPQYTLTLKEKNLSGTSTFTQVISIVDCLFVGVDENSQSSEVSVFPNPVKDVVEIKLPSSVVGTTVRVTNILGSVIHEEFTHKDAVRINLSNNPKGVYFITVQSNNEMITRKIVLE